MTTQQSAPTHSIVLQWRNERKDGQLQKIITEIERIITKIEEVEIERMLVDTKKNWNDGVKTRRTNSHSFYWKIS